MTTAARRSLRVLLSEMASYVNGHTLLVDGGSSVMPPYDDGDDLPVFVTDPQLRERLTRP